MRIHRILTRSIIVLAVCGIPSPGFSQGTPTPVPSKPGIRVSDALPDRGLEDQLKGAIRPRPLTGAELTSKLAAAGITGTVVTDEKPLYLTVVAPRQPAGNLTLSMVSTTHTDDATGSALVGTAANPGTANVFFNIEPGARYLVDYSISFIPCYGCRPDETHHLIARTWPDWAVGAGTGGGEATRQEFVVSREPQHILFIASGNNRRMKIELSAYTLPAGSTRPTPDHFVFHSVQISKLR